MSSPTRIVMTSIALAGALCLASAASASTVACDDPVVNAAPAAHATRVARSTAVHPTTAASNSTRHVAHDAPVHHRRHARTHHIEPSLRAHVVTAASLPARLPRPHVPRSGHRPQAPALSHRDAGTTRTGGTTGLPVSSASALSIAILGTCVHQRTRDRLRSVSQPLESRGPPRAGPFTTLAACRSRGAREFAGASAQHPPLEGSYNSRVSPSPLRVPPHLAPPTPACVSLERPEPLRAQRIAPAAARDARLACASRPFPVFHAVRGPMAPRGVPVRGRILYADDPSIRRSSE